MAKKEKIFEELDRTAPLIPAATYWLNTDNIIMGGNDLCLETVGWRKGGSVKSVFAGKTYYDYYPRAIADELTSIVSIVLKNNKPTKTMEKIVDLTTGKFRYYATARNALFSDNGKVVGTICSVVEIKDKDRINQFISDAIEPITQLASKFENAEANIRISNRELDCIKLLKEGLSSKQIASILHISKRTVEQHIDTAKNKFSCRNSVELIYKCFKNGILQ